MGIRGWSLNADLTLQDLLDIQEHFGLPSPALVEKDYYVAKALAAIMGADIGDIRLVFSGGTALATKSNIPMAFNCYCE